MLKSDVRGASWIRRCLLPWWTNEPGAEEMEKLEDRVANLRTDTMVRGLSTQSRRVATKALLEHNRESQAID